MPCRLPVSIPLETLERIAANAQLPTFTLSAGSFEEVVRGTTASMVKTLRNLNANMTFDVFAGGHDDLIWSEQFVRTIDAGPQSAAN